MPIFTKSTLVELSGSHTKEDMKAEGLVVKKSFCRRRGDERKEWAEKTTRHHGGLGNCHGV